MPVFFLLAACLALVLIGVGIVAAAVAVVALAVMVALGITSSAVLVGLLRRNLSSGVRALHYQICIVIGIPAGVAVLGIASWILENDVERWKIVAAGSVGGACAGLVLAFVFDRLARVIYQRIVVEGTTSARESLIDSPSPRG